jgi:serine/threonine protein kinase
MLTVGTVLRNRYRILRVLGSGGFGDTYLAEDQDLPGHPRCVVKQLRPKDNNPEVMRIAKGLFEREAEYLYRIGNAHPEIPDLFAHFTEGGEFYLVQEFIEGTSLAEEIPPGKKLSETEVIRLLLDILEVLSFVHQQNVIHRDIKLTNLLRRKSDGKIVLIDFGAVKDVSVLQTAPSGLTNMTVSIGSPGYMPSEQAQGKPKLSSDVYAVGMIGIQALTGVPPANLPEDVHTGEILWQDLVSISPAFAQVLQKMTHYHFGQRYRSAIEALAALKAVAYQTSAEPTQLIVPADVPPEPSTAIINPIPSSPIETAKPLPTSPAIAPKSKPPVTPTPNPVPATEIAPKVHPPARPGTNPIVVLAILALTGIAIGAGIWFATRSTPKPVVTTGTPTPEPTPETPVSPTPTDTPTAPPPPPTKDLYGSIARSRNTQDKGYSWNFSTQTEAEQEALKQCASVSGAMDCAIMVWFRNACGSIAESIEGGAGAGWGVNEELAEMEALKSCSTVGTGCSIVKTICTAHATP